MRLIKEILSSVQISLFVNASSVFDLTSIISLPFLIASISSSDLINSIAVGHCFIVVFRWWSYFVLLRAGLNRYLLSIAKSPRKYTCCVFPSSRRRFALIVTLFWFKKLLLVCNFLKNIHTTPRSLQVKSLNKR